MGTARKPSRKPITRKRTATGKKTRTQSIGPSPSSQRVITPTDIVPDDRGFPIVGIGASAGGLEALEEFFRYLPADSGMAFVVVSHQPSSRTSLLPSLLRQCTGMELHEATDGMNVEPNYVYLAQAGKNLAILHGMLHLMEPDQRDRVPLPIDYLFSARWPKTKSTRPSASSPREPERTGRSG